MDIIQLKGTEKKLYTLVGPLVMDAEILKHNNNYAFKTSKKHTWFVAVEKRKVIGFMPVVFKGATAYIDNYYIEDDKEEIADALLDQITDTFASTMEISALVHKRHLSLFARNHFVSTKEWKNYHTMTYAISLTDNNE